MWRWFAGILMCSTIVIGSSAAQDEIPWTTWLYDSNHAHAVQLAQTGLLINDESLPIPAIYAPGTFTLSRGLAVSYDGARLAYSVTGTDPAGQQITTLIVYDVASDAVLLTYQPPVPIGADALSLSRHPALFNLTGSAIAYSYAVGVTPEEQRWHLIVFDTLTHNQLSELDNNNPTITRQNYEGQIAPVLLPAINYYEGATVNFSLVAYASMAFGQESTNFDWDVITGRLLETNQFPNLAGDYLPRIGDSIVPISDARVIADEAAMPYANALHVYRADMGARIPFYATSALEMLRVDFVQNGEKIVAQGENLTDLTPLAILVERNGIARALPALNLFEREIIGTPTGFLYLSDSQPQVAIHALTDQNPPEQTALWVAPPDTQFIPVWATPPERDTQYPAWAQLAPPLFLAQTVVIPEEENPGVSAAALSNAAPIGQGVLTINGVAIISTTEGDRLNMRSLPGLNGEIVARVDQGSRVVILDGPVAQDGFTWWKVRLNTGLVGWVVEDAEGVQTLVPVG